MPTRWRTRTIGAAVSSVGLSFGGCSGSADVPVSAAGGSAGILDCKEGQRLEEAVGAVDPDGLVSIREAVQFEVDTKLPDFDAEIPALTSDDADSDRVDLRYVSDDAGAVVTLFDGDSVAGTVLTLELTGKVWHVQSLEACNEFFDRYDGVDSGDDDKTFEPTGDTEPAEDEEKDAAE